MQQNRAQQAQNKSKSSIYANPKMQLRKPQSAPTVDLNGKYKEVCYASSCSKPKSATFYNFITKQYYCESCAKKLEAEANKAGMSVFDNLTPKVLN